MSEQINEDDLISLIKLDDKTQKLAETILEEDNLEETKRLVNIFNLNLAKKNVIRLLKFNSLLDKVSDQMLARFNKCPGEFSNSDLLNYLSVTQNAIDRANKSIALVDQTPAIQLNQVNINNNIELTRESKENIINAVKSLMDRAKQLSIVDDSIEGEIIEQGDEKDDRVQDGEE